MKTRALALGFVGLTLLAGCSPGAGESHASASATASSAPRAAPSSAAVANTSASAAAAPVGPPTAVLGGADWKAVFAGAPPVALGMISGGGQGTGVAEDLSLRLAWPSEPPTKWEKTETQVGAVFHSPKNKVILVVNMNQKTDPDVKTVDLWSKSALIKDFKSTGGPEIVEVGPQKVAALAGAGTCTLKEGGPADLYWFDSYGQGDFSHSLQILIVAKDAPEDEKSVALSILRTYEVNEKYKPHYKKG